MACIMNRALSLFCLLSCMAHCTCFIANCMCLCFIYVNRVVWAAVWPYGSAEPHGIGPSVFLSKWLHLNECVLRQTLWPSSALQILAWTLASSASHAIYPSGIGGQEEEGRCAPLRSLSLCRFYTQTHGGHVCVRQCRVGPLWADARSGAGWARLGLAVLVADDEWRSPGGLCEGWQAALWGSPTSPAQAACGINQTSPPASLSLSFSLSSSLHIPEQACHLEQWAF